MITFYLIENFTYIISIISNTVKVFIVAEHPILNFVCFLNPLNIRTGFRLVVLSFGFLFFKISDDELAGIQKLEISEMQSINQCINDKREPLIEEHQ
jgi:hypothetical protein